MKAHACALEPGQIRIPFDPRSAVRRAIDAAYALCDDGRPRLTAQPLSLREMQTFESLLCRWALLHSRAAPLLCEFLQVAEATVERFTSPLAEALMKFPWPDELGLGDQRAGDDLSCYPRLDFVGPGDGERTIQVQLHGRQYQVVATGHPLHEAVGLGWRRELSPLGCNRQRTWPPEDRAATLVAAQLVTERRARRQTEPTATRYQDCFSLAGGVDVRETIRHIARGDDVPLAVRQAPRRVKQNDTVEPPSDWPFPIVYVFSNGRPRSGDVWMSWYAPICDAAGRRTSKRFHTIVGLACRRWMPGMEQARWQVVAHLAPLMWGCPETYDARQIDQRSLWQRWLEDGHESEMPTGDTNIHRIEPDLGKGGSPAESLFRLAPEVRPAAGHCRGGRRRRFGAEAPQHGRRSRQNGRLSSLLGDLAGPDEPRPHIAHCRLAVREQRDVAWG